MKLKQITLIDACRRASEANVYIMIHLTEETSDELIKLGDAYFAEEGEEIAPAAAPAKVEEIKPAGEFSHEDQWAEEEKPTQKKGKYDVGKVCALRRANWSISKIAEEMGCSDPTVRKILKQEGMV